MNLKTHTALLACAIGLPCIASADSHGDQPELVITSLSKDGTLTWTDELDVPAGYKVEWASQVDGEWSDNWSSLSLVRALLTADQPEADVQVPMFYRVVKIEGFESLPEAVDDSDFYDDSAATDAKVQLGNFLFFDKILSGNRNISCATCHHSMAATGDGLSLPIGEGGTGLGVTRDTGSEEAAVPERVPRNAPHVFNLGAREFEIMFHDGRVAVDVSQPQGFLSPATDRLPPGLENVLAVQAMFPVTSGTEMAGQANENDIADLAAADDLPGVWAALAARLQAIPEYVELFKAAFPEITDGAQITYVHAANAIAAFEAEAWRADDSPFDRFLRGDKGALSDNARNGLELFYGKAGCASCHSGPFQTDQSFHAIAMPQIGCGKGDRADGRDGSGRQRVTADDAELFKFRTLCLRNVTITGPWGHGGAYNSLRAVVEHHLDPVVSLDAYDTAQAVFPSREDLDAHDFVVADSPERRAPIAAANELDPVSLTDAEIDLLMQFLESLTDTASADLRSDTPSYLPSGLPLFD
jgi:cytochrome c peroxidase